MNSKRFALAIHGGAGTITKASITQQLQAQYKSKLMEALDAGQKILKSQGTALDAVEAAVRVLEDSELFNAGRGSVLTDKGTIQMEASIMEGNTRKAGSVTMVQKVKNPISLARRVMERTSHVMLGGSAADEFGESQGLELREFQYFLTEERSRQLKQAKQQQIMLLDHTPAPFDNKIKQSVGATQATTKQLKSQQKKISEQQKIKLKESNKFGTVGAVAVDVYGNLASATSTGGLTNKMQGRIGDTPLIGAGCYANNKTCAVSCTGRGEFFIRGVVAYDINSLMEFTGASLQQAANKVIFQRFADIGGIGGVIAVDAKANIAMPFSSQGMYRGFVNSQGDKKTMIYHQ